MSSGSVRSACATMKSTPGRPAIWSACMCVRQIAPSCRKPQPSDRAWASCHMFPTNKRRSSYILIATNCSDKPSLNRQPYYATDMGMDTMYRDRCQLCRNDLQNLPRFAALPRLGLQKGQQIGVELLLVREGEAVGRARIDFQGGVLDDLRGAEGRGTDRHDLVVVAVDDQGRNVDLQQVFREVRLGEGLDAVECCFEADLHRPQPEHVPNAL